MRAGENDAFAWFQPKPFGYAIAYEDAEAVVPEAFHAAVDYLIFQIRYGDVILSPYAVYADGMGARTRIEYACALENLRYACNSGKACGRLSEFFGIFDTLDVPSAFARVENEELDRPQILCSRCRGCPESDRKPESRHSCRGWCE